MIISYLQDESFVSTHFHARKTFSKLSDGGAWLKRNELPMLVFMMVNLCQYARMVII